MSEDLATGPDVDGIDVWCQRDGCEVMSSPRQRELRRVLNSARKSLTMQAEIDEKKAHIEKQDERIRALETGPGCRWSHDKDAATIADLQAKWEAEQGVIVELRAEVLDLKARYKESQNRHKLDMIQQDADQKYIAKLQNERTELRRWQPNQALKEAVITSGIGGVTDFVIHLQQEHEREMKGSKMYRACNELRTELERLRIERDQLAGEVVSQKQELAAAQRRINELLDRVEEWRAEAKGSDAQHERWQTKAEGLAADHGRLLAEKVRLDDRVNELARECEKLTARNETQARRIQELTRPLTKEDYNQLAVDLAMQAQAQATQSPPHRIPAYCMHDWRDAIDSDAAPIPGVIRCIHCGTSQHVGEEIDASFEECGHVEAEMGNCIGCGMSIDGIGKEPENYFPPMCKHPAASVFFGKCQYCGAYVETEDSKKECPQADES